MWALPGSTQSWERDVQVALLAAGERSAVAGFSAIALHGLVAEVPEKVELLVPHDRTVTSTGALVRRTRTLAQTDVVTVRGFRATTVERTACDVAGRRADRWPEERDAWAWLMAEGLPPDEMQFPVLCSDGVEVRADFAWLPERVSIEYLGGRWHSLPQDVATDAVRSNGIVTAGWFQLLLTKRQLERRDRRFLEQLRGVLAQRGTRFDAVASSRCSRSTSSGS